MRFNLKKKRLKKKRLSPNKFCLIIKVKLPPKKSHLSLTIEMIPTPTYMLHMTPPSTYTECMIFPKRIPWN